MAASLLGLGLLLGGGRAYAQAPATLAPPTLTFSKEANGARVGDLGSPPAAAPVLTFSKDAFTEQPAAPTPAAESPQRLTFSKEQGKPKTAAPAASEKVVPAATTNWVETRPQHGDSRSLFRKMFTGSKETPPLRPAPTLAKPGNIPVKPIEAAPTIVPVGHTDVMVLPAPTQPQVIVIESPAVQPIIVERPMPVQVPVPPRHTTAYPQEVRPAAAMQRPEPMRPPIADESSEYSIQLDPPGPQKLFKLESEAALFERMRQEARQRPNPERLEFPAEPVLSTESYAGRNFPPMAEVVQPAYVCYNRLYFEDINAERYGWDLGVVQPFLSAGKFYADVVTFPYHAFTDPTRCYECSAGYCLPGDPVPYCCYPPGLSLTGLTAQAAVVTAIPFIIP